MGKQTGRDLCKILFTLKIANKPVIPAQAGIQFPKFNFLILNKFQAEKWIPACAGMTELSVGDDSHSNFAKVSGRLKAIFQTACCCDDGLYQTSKLKYREKRVQI